MDIVCESSHKQLQYLIEKKSADVTTPDTKGLTPLHYVAQNFDPVQAAAEFKADNSDADSTSPSVNTGKDDMDVDGKDKGKEKGDDDKEEVGENDEPKKKTWTNWSVVIAKMLIKHGADVNAQTKDKSTPLMLAKIRDNEELLVFLLDNGAQIAANNVQVRLCVCACVCVCVCVVVVVVGYTTNLVACYLLRNRIAMYCTS
jgi:ankyrin repeat protein